MTSRAFGLGAIAVGGAAVLLGAGLLPPDPSMTLTDGSIGFVANGRLISTATLCPGYTFDGLGAGGPKLSPDQHWVLVDVVGPYLPGDVARHAALVQVRTGRFVESPQFERYLHVARAPATGRLAWRTGELATLRYPDGSTARVADPPPVPLPTPTCAPPTPR